MPKTTRRDVDAWFAECARELHAIHTERQLTPDQVRSRLTELGKRMAGYRIRLWRSD